MLAARKVSTPFTTVDCEQPLPPRRGTLARRVGQERDELVSAESPDGCRGAERVDQAAADVDEDVVAGFVAERVVDLLEAVQVDEQDRTSEATTEVSIQELDE